MLIVCKIEEILMPGHLISTFVKEKFDERMPMNDNTHGNSQRNEHGFHQNYRKIS